MKNWRGFALDALLCNAILEPLFYVFKLKREHDSMFTPPPGAPHGKGNCVQRCAN